MKQVVLLLLPNLFLGIQVHIFLDIFFSSKGTFPHVSSNMPVKLLIGAYRQFGGETT
jgi:hypothetical protein